MFVGTHDTEKPRACVNRLARKCTPSWIKGIILGQGRSVQVKSWTSLEASQDQRCTFAWLLCIFMKETHVWQEHEQISHFISRITPILYAHLVLEPVFHLVQNVLSYFADWQLSPPWIYWNVHERWQPRQWIISLVAVANISQSDYGVTKQTLTFLFFPTNKTTVSTPKKDERRFQTLQYLTGRSQMEGWCCFVFWRVNLRATLAGKPQLFGVVWWFMTDSPSPGRSQRLLWPLPWSTSPLHTPSPSVLALSPRKLDLLSCVCSETGSPLGGTMKLQKKRIPPDLFVNL